MSRWWSQAGIVWAAICLLFVIVEVNAAKGGKNRGLGESRSKTHKSTRCDQPVGPIHGLIQCTSETTQKKCTITCDNGYQFQDNASSKVITCLYKADSWFPKIQECIPKQVEYGNRDQSLRMTGSHDIPPNILGRPAGGTPESEGSYKTCSNPRPPQNSNITCFDIYEGRKCNVKCNPGYSLLDKASLFMTECFPWNNKWYPALTGAVCTPDSSYGGDYNKFEDENAQYKNTDGSGVIEPRIKPSNVGGGYQSSGGGYDTGGSQQNVGGRFGMGGVQQSVGGRYGTEDGQQSVGGRYDTGDVQQSVEGRYGTGGSQQSVGGRYDSTGGSQQSVGGRYDTGGSQQSVGGRHDMGGSQQSVGGRYDTGSGQQSVGGRFNMGGGQQSVGGRFNASGWGKGVEREHDTGSWNKSPGDGFDAGGSHQSPGGGSDMGTGNKNPEGLCKMPSANFLSVKCSSDFVMMKCTGTCRDEMQFRNTLSNSSMQITCDTKIGIWSETFPECIDPYPDCPKIKPGYGMKMKCFKKSNSNMECTALCLGFQREGSLFADGEKSKTLTCKKGIWINGDQFPSCKGMEHTNIGGSVGGGSPHYDNRDHRKPCGNPTHSGGVQITCDSSNEQDSNRECKGICTGIEYKRYFINRQFQHVLICKNGEWPDGKTFPPCERRAESMPPVQEIDLCDEPPEPSRGVRSCSKTTIYKTCVALCNRKYGFKHGRRNETISCKLSEGRWSPESTFSDCMRICDPPCENGGQCMEEGMCLCPKEYRGKQCQYPISNCNEGKIQFSGTVTCRHLTDVSVCELKCPPGYQLDTLLNVIRCNLTGNLLPAILPKCERIQKGSGSVDESNKQPPIPDEEWEMMKPEKKPGYEWGDEHGRRPFQLATSKSTGVCVVWSTYHYRTFDGYIYDFAGTCSYILAKDNLTNTFSIILEHDKGCVNRRVRSGTKCFRTVKIELADAVYQLYAGPDGTVLSQNGRYLPIPYTQGITVEYIARYVVVTLYQDTTIWIDGTDAIYIIPSERFKRNGLLGLCGTYDDVHKNDMMTPSGTLVKRVTTFGNSWKIKEAGVCEDVLDGTSTDICRHDSSENDKIAERAAARCLNINEDEYKYCHEFVEPQQYIEACKIDCCDQEGLQGCECSSFAEYFRECARLDKNKYNAWRKPALCPMKCENGTKYQDCGSACPVTCGAPELPCTIKACVDGCHCPNGMALHEKQCVPINECPCQHNDRWYAHGTSMEINCRNCLCHGGNWECTNNICPALCSSIGDSHFETFDGKRYNFVGYCSYYLVHQEDGYLVEQENSDCVGDINGYEADSHKESILSCKKTVILKTPQGTIVKLKHGMEVTVNSKEIKSLPHLAPGITIRQLTSLYQEAEFSNGLKILWDGWNRIYVVAPPALYGKVQGLCGTFSNSQNDDFITPAGDEEKSVKFFAEKWKVPNGCHSILSYDVLTSSPCDFYPHLQKEAQSICSKIKSEIFKDCKTVIDPEPFYRNCMYYVCSCKSEISSCYCSSLADYAFVCARNNVSVDWRPHIPNCGLRCIGRQQYQTYSKSCEYSCRQISTFPECETEYMEGCACPSGETLDADGNCVPISECPCMYHNHEYPPNFVQRRGRKTCTCIRGRWQCHDSSVAELMTTPSTELLTCLAADHKEYTDCTSDCPITCSNLHDPPTCTMLSCKSGCRCEQGYVLNEDSGICIRPKDCPCHHGKRSYKDKEKIRIDCKQCECRKGYWECDKDDCPGVCSSWGNSHFKTFDGHFYDFQGTCEYVLTSGKITGKETFSIVIQNEKCGTKGITCSKMISFSIGNDRITFSKNVPPPRINPNSQFMIKEVGMFVYVTTNIGISMQWDKDTRVYVHALPIWNGKLKGLCGDFNGDSIDDFKQPSGNIPATQAIDFANSWKIHPYCEKPIDIPESCVFHSERRDWALKKCKVLRSSLFGECHSEVDLEPYYESCVFDTCACDMGGDCECLCTAIAAYAYECAHNGIYVYWRSQELCPIQCEECDHYSPCISTCPPETCETWEIEGVESLEKTCREEGPCSEGCDPNVCPPGQIYNTTKDHKCIPREDCTVFESPFACMNINGRDYKLGEQIDDPEISDKCRTCYCTRLGISCTGHACPSSYEPTSTTEISCISGWSQWLNFSSPNAEKIYTLPCPIYQVNDIECRPMRSISDSTECSLSNGLSCFNGQYQETSLCFKYEIRAYCNCESETGYSESDYEETGAEYTEEPEIVTSYPLVACGLPMFTDWMTVSIPGVGTVQELISKLRQNYTFCGDNDILSVECDISPKPGISHSRKKRKIKKCAARDGTLICGSNIRNKKPCKARILCNCVVKDLQLPNVTCLENTPWINVDRPDDGIDFESLHRIPAIEKLCPKVTSTRCRITHNNSSRPPPASDYNIRCTGGEVACKTDSKYTCPDYAVTSTCKCAKKPTPPRGPLIKSTLPLKTLSSTAPCPPGSVWDDCAINCEQTCKPFKKKLSQRGKCLKDNHCVAGCRLIECSYPKVWHDEQTCVLERECPCMTEVGEFIGPGQVVKINDCEKCHCLNNYLNCVQLANCSSDELHYTEQSIIESDCWTHWINSDDPSSGPGDFEKLSILQQKYNFCSNPIEVQCRDAITKRDAKDINQDVTCNKMEGLACWNNRTQCNDYEIRFFCPCSSITPFSELKPTITIAPEVCQQGWSAWFNSHIVDNTGDYDNLQLVEQNGGNKICVNGTITSVNCRRKFDRLSYRFTNQYITCKSEEGLLCENSKQIKGERCDDYEIAFFCDCFEQTSPIITPTVAYSVSPTSIPSFIRENIKETSSQYTTSVPFAMPACWEFVPLINGETKLSDDNLKESSKRSSEYGAENIRISPKPIQHSGKAWIPAILNKDQYVEIDLTEPRLIYGITTQGREDYQEWVTSYYLLYSNDGYFFTQYENPHSSEKVISGNYDSRSLVKVIFDTPFEARYVRIQPNTWEGQIALRVELLGCSKTADVTEEGYKTYVCLEPMGLENGKLLDAQMTAPSQHDWSHTPSDGRIGGSSWVAGVSDYEQYLQVDFFDPTNISAIITQGREKENQWVSAYMVSYSNDGNTWTVISDEQDKSKLKIFPGNYDDEHFVVNYLPRTLRTRYLRILPVKWKNWISLKLEILGCYHPYREIITTTIGEVIYALPRETVPSSALCLQPMGLSSPALSAKGSLPDDLITVSSSELGAGSSRLRLNTKAHGTKKGGWIPKSWDKNPSVQIDFVIPSTLTSITTKGIEGTSRWINSYRIFVSNDTYNWQPVYSEQTPIFKGNTDDSSEKNNMFDTPVTARYFKLEVIGSENSHPGLRMEIFGCYHEYEMVSTTPLIPYSLEMEENCIKYGPWKSLSNPNLLGSNGDFESIKDIIASSKLCTNPIDIECQTYGAHISYKHTGQNVTCDLTNGLSCWNRDQRDGRCFNYEVRIKCWTCPMEENDNDILPGLFLCPELPRHMAKNCPVCPKNLLCNGKSCVDAADCSCIHGNKIFQAGQKIITNLKKCVECECTLGGHSLCYNKSCHLCLPDQKPKLLPDCSCSCENCKPGEKMCTTNKECILEKQWCDGIQDCPDDEINCPVVPSVAPEVTTSPPTELGNGTCQLLGKRIRTVDGQELDYEICDHVVFLDALYNNFNVTVRKECSQNPPICRKVYLIQQDETSVRIDNDMNVTINENNYTASQLTLFNKRSSNITVEVIGNHIVVKSKVYGFTVIRDQRANLRVEMSAEMKNRTTGLCGLYNGKAFDDKKKPDGKIAVTSKEFGDSWANNDSKECVSSNCSNEFAEKALETCKKLREDPFDICKDYLNIESYVQACISSTCDCMMEDENKISECKCAAFLPLLEACENKLHRSLSKWRSKHGCAPSCAPGLVWEDCGTGCQLTCDSISMQDQSCLETCVPGCFCPAGTVLDNKKCVLPEDCSDAICQGFGDPHFSTFDGLYYPFQAAGRFVFATDKKNTFSIEGESGKCSTFMNGTCLSSLTINYRNTVVKITKEKPVTIDGESATMEMLPLQFNGIVVLGFPGQVYLVIIPELSIVVRYYEVNNGFSINIPSERFHDKTRGLCGNCNGKQNDEMVPAYDMIMNSTGDFVCSWVKDETFTKCKTTFHEKSLVSLENKCPEILDSTFAACHPIVDFALYEMSCSYDVVYSSNRHDAICKTLMEYSRQCCQAGIVLTDWFNKYNCEIPCPNGTIYHHCHDACPQTCQKSSETVDCHDYKVDGCFCPENMVLKDGVCVNEVYCKLPKECIYTSQYGIDSKGNEFLLPSDKQKSSQYKIGETWQDGLCRNCICKESNGQYIPYCTVAECPDYKKLAEYSDYEIMEYSSPWTCCPKLWRTHCKDEDGKLMAMGEKWKNKTDPCKEFECGYSGGHASKITKDVKCECKKDEEEQPPAENECCGKCIKKYCIVNNELYSVGTQWNSGNCYIGECVEQNGQAIERVSKNCSQVPDGCPKEYVVRDENDCCDVCNTTLGAIGCNTIQMDLKTGELKHENKEHGKCVNAEPLAAVIKCSGICESESMYSLENGEIASTCKCCSPVDIQIREIELKCNDGTIEPFKLNEPKACKCSPCAASAKNKDKTNTSKKSGSRSDEQFAKYPNQAISEQQNEYGVQDSQVEGENYGPTLNQGKVDDDI